MTVRLLVADDSATIQKIVSLAFSDEDVVIQSAFSGESALETLQSFRPDLVLADVFMPGCSGYEVCARIKQDSNLANIPVILLVGTFEAFDELEAARVKSDGYLTKPFDTSELIQTVHSLIGDKMAPQKNEGPAEFQAPAFSKQPLNYTSSKGLVSPRAWESFLGSDRILELFDSGILAQANSSSWTRQTAYAAAMRAAKPSEPTPSEDFVNLIVDKVMRRMSSDVIREVAWEVVPELSEVLIRRALEARNKP